MGARRKDTQRHEAFHDEQAKALAELVLQIKGCRICRDNPKGARLPLPHEPRPVLRVGRRAKICICGQAPGTRVHASQIPFTDPSGVRLREWMGVSEDEFYDAARVSIVPMGFCFPGLSQTGADLPPRPECSKTWHGVLFDALPSIELLLLVGGYAQKWHLKRLGHKVPRTVTDTVANWSAYAHRIDDHDMNEQGAKSFPVHPTIVPLPHPSWRNNGWIKKHQWFEADLIPHLQTAVRDLLSQ